MKKAVFMSENKAAIPNAYAESLRAEMAEVFEFLPDIYTLKDESEDRAALADVEVIFSTWGMPRLDEEQIKSILPNLKAVFYGAGSVQYFARPYMACGVEIFSAWAANAVPVAEVTVAEIILANKGYYQRMQYEDGAWTNRAMKNAPLGNYNTNVGIIGAGMIGKLVIKMLAPYKLNVFVFDPFLPQAVADELGVTMVDDLPTLFEKCHVISNHLANNPQTVGMINKSCFDRMMPSAVFINTGRGAQVVEDDMIAALKECPERVALLDVTMPEPPVADSEMYKMRNIILTPHLAGSIGLEVQRMGEYMFEESRRWLNGENTFWGVTEKMLETMA